MDMGKILIQTDDATKMSKIHIKDCIGYSNIYIAKHFIVNPLTIVNALSLNRSRFYYISADPLTF
jgi:hypothetical protein